MTKLRKLMLAALLLTVTTAHSEEIKLRNNGDACTSSNEGAIYYDDGDDTFYFCRNASTGWEAFEDLAPASSGGGVPTYMGLTAASTNGSLLNGVSGMDAECASNYAGSRMMNSSDYKHVRQNIVSSGWVECDAVTVYSNSWICSNLNAPAQVGNSSAPYANCREWNTSSSGYFGLLVGNNSSTFSTCNYSYRIHCVKD